MVWLINNWESLIFSNALWKLWTHCSAFPHQLHISKIGTFTNNCYCCNITVICLLPVGIVSARDFTVLFSVTVLSICTSICTEIFCNQSNKWEDTHVWLDELWNHIQFCLILISIFTYILKLSFFHLILEVCNLSSAKYNILTLSFWEISIKKDYLQFQIHLITFKCSSWKKKSVWTAKTRNHVQ